MKRWSNNKKTGKELPSFVNTALARLNQHLVRIASVLQAKTNAYSTKKKKVLLLFFVALFIAGSAAVTIQSVVKKSKAPIVLTRMKTLPVEKGKGSGIAITRAEFLKIQKFRNYIDSLNATAKGRSIRDSLLHNRPHLLDSVNLLMNLYSEQLKLEEK